MDCPPQDLSRRRDGLPEKLIVLLLYVGCVVVVGPTLQFSQWYVGPENNQGAAEALAWLDGRIDLESRGGDIARYEGRNYSIFPPLWTIICFAVYGLNQLVFGEPLVFWSWLYVLVVAGPIPFFYYLAFRRAGTSSGWAAVLAFGAVAGTCLWPVATMLSGTRTAWIYSIQHILAQNGLALIVMDLLGRKRFWPAGLGVLIAAWSRQPCYLYALPILWLAFRSPQRANALLRAGIPIAVACMVTGGLNYAKFGSPFESGYRYLFAEVDLPEDDSLRGPDGEIEITSLRYLPGHAYDMFISPPDIYMTANGPIITGAGPRTALWFGTPLFALTVVGVRRWWSDQTKRTLMLSTLPVMFVALVWHGPIEGCPGYYRYTLDFGFIWLAVIAAWTEQPRMRLVSLLCVAWGVFYFYMLGRT